PMRLNGVINVFYASMLGHATVNARTNYCQASEATVSRGTRRSGVRGQGGARAAAADLHPVGTGEARGWLTGGQLAGSVLRALDREAGVGDHGQVGGAGLALAREVVAEEDRVHD